MAENPRLSKMEEENPQASILDVPAELVEGRGMVKRNPDRSATSRMQGRNDVPHALERVRQAAKKDKKLRFTALLHTSTTSITFGKHTSRLTATLLLESTE